MFHGRGPSLHIGDQDGRPVHVPATELEVLEVRPFRRGYLLRFGGVADRATAERYAGRYLLRPFSDVRPPDDDEYFYHELLGMEVRVADGTAQGAPIGTVREVYEVEPDHLLEVVGPDRSVLLPLSKRIITRIDRDGGVLEVDPPAGLLDL